MRPTDTCCIAQKHERTEARILLKDETYYLRQERETKIKMMDEEKK